MVSHETASSSAECSWDKPPFSFVRGRIRQCETSWSNVLTAYDPPPCLYLVTSKMWCWSGGRGILTELSLCYSIIYQYNGARWYEQFWQVSLLHRALVLIGLVFYLLSTSVSSIFMKLYVFEQEVKVIWQKAPHGGPIPRLGVTPGGRKLYHWIPGVGVPISVP